LPCQHSPPCRHSRFRYYELLLMLTLRHFHFFDAVAAAAMFSPLIFMPPLLFAALTAIIGDAR